MRADERRTGVAAEAVGSFIADGAGGGQYATKPAKGKSRRWQDGNSRSDKAVARSATAWFSTRHGSRLQAASRRAVFSLAGAVVQRRRGRRSGGDRRHEASARLYALWRGFSRRRGSDGAGLAGFCASPVTERSESLQCALDAASTAMKLPQSQP